MCIVEITLTGRKGSVFCAFELNAVDIFLSAGKNVYYSLKPDHPVDILAIFWKKSSRELNAVNT